MSPADPATLRLRDFAPPDGVRSPRSALCFLPRACDIAIILAAGRGALARGLSAGRAPDGPVRVIDVGAGSGLLSRLLTDAGAVARAVDPGGPHARDVGRFHDVDPVDAASAARGGPYDVAVSAFMEAGAEYRSAVAGLAPVVVSIRDTEGMCGVRGDQSYSPFGLTRVHSHQVPTFEDVGALLRLGPRGVAVPLHGRLEVWATEAVADAVAASLAAPPPASGPGIAAYPWEMDVHTLMP